jgi:hypothetical protein
MVTINQGYKLKTVISLMVLMTSSQAFSKGVFYLLEIKS